MITYVSVNPDTRTSQKGITDLVGLCPGIWNEGYVMFCTISPNPTTVVDVVRNGKDQKMCYGQLPLTQQYAYCKRILHDCYLGFLKDPYVVGTTEVNKQGHVHLHFLLKSKSVTTDMLMNVFRRDISLCREVVKNRILRKRGQTAHAPDFMNNIVRLTKPLAEVVSYMDKCYHCDNMKLFPNYYRLDVLETCPDPESESVIKLIVNDIIDVVDTGS